MNCGAKKCKYAEAPFPVLQYHTMKYFKLIVLLGAFAAAIYVWYYFSKPAENTKLSHLSGVIITAPPEFYIVSPENPARELSLPQAAAEAERILRENPGRDKIGLKFISGGGEAYLLIDRANETIQLLAANTYGTAVQTTWKGNIRRRIEWCIEHGNFSAEGLSQPVSRNLYH